MRYAIWCGIVVAAFAALEVSGVDLAARGQRENIPPSVRSSPGGYRSYHFWHSGYQGGK